MADDTIGRIVRNDRLMNRADGLLGIGYAHTMNPPRQPRKPSTILLRWTQTWEPLCVLESKRADDPVAAFADYKSAHDRRIRHLLAAGIAWTTITHGDLDSPLQSGTEFDRGLCLAIERRRCRLGRIKGMTKGRVKR